jgi:hypothetical protein
MGNLYWHGGLLQTSSSSSSSSSATSSKDGSKKYQTDMLLDAPSMTDMIAAKQRHSELRLEQMQESINALQQKLLLVGNTNSATTTTTASETTAARRGDDVLPPLPTCRQLMSGPYSQFRDGEFLTSSSAHHVWVPRADGSRQLELTFPCRLHRYTAQEARQCLRGQHMSLMGDSLSRYLFLSLSFFMQHGVWPPRFGQARGQFGYESINSTTTTTKMKKQPPQRQPVCPHIDEQGQATCSPMGEPNPVMEGDWKRNLQAGQDSWETFLEQIGGGTDGGIFSGHMECDCARSSRPGKGELCKAECQVENELYISGPANDQGEWEEDHQGDTNNDIDYSRRILFSHVKENGWGDPPRNVSGFSFTKCGASGSCRRDQNTTNFMLERAMEGVFEWNEPLASALQNSLKRILPPVSIGIYNKGLWGAVSKETLDRVMPALYNFTGGEDGRCFFRSTTGSAKSLKANLEEHERGLVQSLTHQHGCNFLDFGRLTEDFARIEYREGQVDRASASFLLQERNSIYWDNVHFMPWVYEELNNMQLNVLCNAYGGTE